MVLLDINSCILVYTKIYVRRHLLLSISNFPPLLLWRVSNRKCRGGPTAFTLNGFPLGVPRGTSITLNRMEFGVGYASEKRGRPLDFCFQQKRGDLWSIFFLYCCGECLIVNGGDSLHCKWFSIGGVEGHLHYFK